MSGKLADASGVSVKDVRGYFSLVIGISDHVVVEGQVDGIHSGLEPSMRTYPKFTAYKMKLFEFLSTSIVVPA